MVKARGNSGGNDQKEFEVNLLNTFIHRLLFANTNLIEGITSLDVVHIHDPVDHDIEDQGHKINYAYHFFMLALEGPIRRCS